MATTELCSVSVPAGV